MLDRKFLHKCYFLIKPFITEGKELSGRIVSVIMLTLLLVAVLMRVYDATVIDANTGAYVYEDPEFIYLGNEYLEIQLSKSDKGAIYSLIDKTSDEDFIKEKNSARFMFFVYPIMVHQTDALEFYFSTVTTENNLTLCLEWQDFSVGIQVFNLTVSANITVTEASSRTIWQMTTENRDFDTHVSFVDFPIIAGLSYIGNTSSDDYFIAPFEGGVLFKDPSNNIISTCCAYPASAEVQFMGFYDQNVSGLLLATLDNTGHPKQFKAGPMGSDSWLMQIAHLSIFENGFDFSPPYNVVLEFFHGDGYSAADIYKHWAKNQWWAENSSQKKIPDWFKRSSVWHESIRYYNNESGNWEVSNPFGNMSSIVITDSQFLDVPFITSIIGWEKLGAYATFGNWFPPVEGWDSFDRMISDIHHVGGKVFMMIDTYRYDITLPNWKEYGIKISDVNYFLDHLDVNDGTVTVFNCPSTEFWKNKLADAILTLVRHGVDLITLDGFCVLLEPCINENHDHPKGYGTWWFESCRDLVLEIRESARSINPEVVFVSEGISEVYIPYFDSFAMWDNAFEFWWPQIRPDLYYSGAKPVPLFDYIYGECFIVKKGFHARRDPWLVGIEDQYSLKVLGYSFVDGQPLYIAESVEEPLTNPYDDLVWSYVKKAAIARSTYAYDFLVSGKMCKNPSIDIPEVTINGPWGEAFPPQISFPGIQFNTWKASDGRIAVIATNIWNETLSFNLSLNLTEYGLPNPSFVYIIRNGESQLLGTSQEIFNYTHRIEPQEILLTVFSSNVEELPDLQVVNMKMGTAKHSRLILCENESISIETSIFNTGLDGASPFNVSLCVYFEEESNLEYFENKLVSNLEAEGNITLEFQFTPQNIGKYVFSIEADSDDKLSEINEINNIQNYTIESFFPILINGIEMSKSIVGDNNIINMEVSISNIGSFNQTYLIDIMSNSSLLINYTGILQSGNITKVAVECNTSGLDKGYYPISVLTKLSEENTSYNTFTNSWMFVTIPGDVDGDKIVDIFDCVTIALAFGSIPDNPNWNPNADINGDGVIDIFDLVNCSIHFGQNWQP